MMFGNKPKDKTLKSSSFSSKAKQKLRKSKSKNASLTPKSTKNSNIQIKKFTFKQIQEKVAERWQIPEYYDILMEAAVREDDDGVEFNLKHKSFQVNIL